MEIYAAKIKIEKLFLPFNCGIRIAKDKSLICITTQGEAAASLFIHHFNSCAGQRIARGEQHDGKIGKNTKVFIDPAFLTDEILDKLKPVFSSLENHIMEATIRLSTDVEF